MATMADGADVAYSFPMLSSKKIVGYLGDLNVHVSEQVSCDTRLLGRQRKVFKSVGVNRGGLSAETRECGDLLTGT